MRVLARAARRGAAADSAKAAVIGTEVSCQPMSSTRKKTILGDSAMVRDLFERVVTLASSTCVSYALCVPALDIFKTGSLFRFRRMKQGFIIQS